MNKDLLGYTIQGQGASSKMLFSDANNPPTDLTDEGRFAKGAAAAEPSEVKFPPPILDDWDQEEIDELKRWLSTQLQNLISAQKTKVAEFTTYEDAYRARKQTGTFLIPFKGACDDNIPAIAMGVDPVQARLDVGIMKQSPVFTVKPLRKSLVDYREALEDWIEFNQKHRWRLRQIASPRFMELAKLGTCVFKTVYDREESKIKTYRPDDKGGYEVYTKNEIRFSGARVLGLQLSNLLFPPGYSTVQDCPIIAERINYTAAKLLQMKSSGKLANIEELPKWPKVNLSEMEQEQQKQTNHEYTQWQMADYEAYECWFDYIDRKGMVNHMVATMHLESRTLLQLRYNWYFHQKKPYVVIPYTIVDGTLYGMGLAEMIWPLQMAITRWHRMATDNAYLANIRLYIAKKNSGIEETPRIFAGRTFYVDDPSKDFKAFQAGDIYPSTMMERQNLFGMVEKRTGVSDYLTGRESPILGSRATATSTIALIQEGTKRVEETLENIRAGFAEIIENCFYIWIQYGTENVENIVFGQSETAALITQFFDEMTEVDIGGAFSVSLKATDVGENKQARQQMQLSIINVMMGYFEKLLQAGEAALMAMQQLPEFAAMVKDVIAAGHKMFLDLLKDYDIPNSEQYLPDISRYINVPTQPGLSGDQGGPQGPNGAAPGAPGVASILGPGGVPVGAGSAPARNGDGSLGLASLAG